MSAQPHPVLGEVVIASRVVTPELDPRALRRVLWLLCASTAAMMSGTGIITPVIPRRLAELGAGAQVLGWMSAAFGLADIVAAPYGGALADRKGRRAPIVLAVACSAVANLLFVVAGSTGALIVIRGLQGVAMAMLFPAAVGMVADVTRPQERSKALGLVLASLEAGFIFGPIVGGMLCDRWGTSVAFAAAAAVVFLGLGPALALPETYGAQARRRALLRVRRTRATGGATRRSLEWLPRPVHVVAALLALSLLMRLALSFTEPLIPFYLLDELNMTTVEFGTIGGVLSLAVILGETKLGPLSDRFGRRTAIVAGLVGCGAVYVMVAALWTFQQGVVAVVVLGLARGLAVTSLNAFLLDIVPGEHRSRLLGVKSALSSAGGLLGPLAAVAAVAFLSYRQSFVLAGSILFFAALVGLVALTEPEHRGSQASQMAWVDRAGRIALAQSTVRNVVLSAQADRDRRKDR